MENELRQHIAAVIRAARKSKRLTQEEVASLVERTPESLSNLERAHAMPSIETLVALCAVLEIEPDTIFRPRNVRDRKSTNEHRLVQEIHQIIDGLNEPALALAKAQLEAISRFQELA